ncbi:MAG: hypothetical protein D6711_00880 [Chloroflexi bacterium]|nr:MAG: hypothetical protein D6711_00880 [Chloroflexota bacterium]
MDAKHNEPLGKLIIGFLGVLILVNLMGNSWVLFIILPGVAFLYAAMTAQPDNLDQLKLIYPGVIITGTGLILLYQSMTGHWESWAYIWALYPAFVGGAMKWYGEQSQNPEEIAQGESLVKNSLIGFAMLGLLFEVVIFNLWSVFWLLVIAWFAWMALGKKHGSMCGMSHNHHETDEKRKNDDPPKRKNDDIVIV